MQQHSTYKRYGILSMCQFTNVIYIFFNLITELISCDLLCLFTGAVVRCYETKRKLFLQWLPENMKKAAQTISICHYGGRPRFLAAPPLTLNLPLMASKESR